MQTYYPDQQIAENRLSKGKKCQGTTSVVPLGAHKDGRAFAPANLIFVSQMFCPIKLNPFQNLADFG
jgi:hypothetical protein